MCLQECSLQKVAAHTKIPLATAAAVKPQSGDAQSPGAGADAHSPAAVVQWPAVGAGSPA